MVGDIDFSNLIKCYQLITHTLEGILVIFIPKLFDLVPKLKNRYRDITLHDRKENCYSDSRLYYVMN